MFSRHRWDKEMMNRDEEYNRLHDHCQALGRERDGLQIRIMTLLSKIEELSDEVDFLHEKLRRKMP